MILTVTSRKGGTGKTTTALNVGAALAETGARVLLIDLDPSGDLTAHAGIELEDGNNTVYEVLMGEASAQAVIRHIERDTGTAYDVIPADEALYDLTADMDADTLRRALRGAAEQYDWIVIDTPGGVDASTGQALAAADSVLIPVQPAYAAFDSVGTIRDAIEAVNPSAGMGLVLTGYSSRTRYHRDIRETLESSFPGALYDTAISNAVGVSEAWGAGTDIFDYARQTPARRRMAPLAQYRALAQEIADRAGMMQTRGQGNGTNEIE